MAEQTTTDTSSSEAVGDINGVAIDAQGMAVPVSEPTGDDGSTAESTPEVSQQADVTESNTETSSNWDDETRSWAESKGIDLETPEGVAKAIKNAQEAERQFHKTSQEKSNLEKIVSSGELTAPMDDSEASILRSEIAQIKLENQVNAFWQNNPEAKQFEPAMVSIVESRPHLANDLDALYALARVQSGSDKVSGGKEALETLASKQRAAAATGNAVTSAPAQSNKITPQNVDQLVAQNDQAWFRANYKEINKAMDG